MTSEIRQAANELFEEWPFQPVRLIGVTAEKLSGEEGQAGLFPNEDREG